MPETIVFFRDDDVGEYTAPLGFLMDVLLEEAIPCHYQVVPDYLNAESAAELRLKKQAHPNLIHFNQHGLHHEQQLNGRRSYSEFAGGRDYEDQYRDILQGRDQLEQMLGEAFSSDLFTPPCHKYDGETLRALGDLGFSTLSAGVRVDWPSQIYYAAGRLLNRVDFMGKRVSYHQRLTPEPRISEISVTIDVHEDQDAEGHVIEKGAEHLWAEFSRVRTKLKAVGIMTHHQACETPEKQHAFKTFVAQLVVDPSIRFADMLDLVPARSGS